MITISIRVFSADTLRLAHILEPLLLRGASPSYGCRSCLLVTIEGAIAAPTSTIRAFPLKALDTAHLVPVTPWPMG